MKEFKYTRISPDKESPEVKRRDKVKSDGGESEGKRCEARSPIRSSCGCGCAPFAKEK